MTRYERIPERSEARQYLEDEIDLRQLFVTLWQGKWIIVATTILFAVAGVFYVLSKPNVYQASVLLAPAQNEGNAGGLSAQLSGLASIAGISLDGGGSNKTVMAKQVLQSRAFLTDFIRKHNLSVPLMATKSWDMQKQEWVINREVYNPETDEWLKDEGGGSLAPTDWDLVKKFKENHLSTSEETNTGMLTLNVKSLSPVAAKNWAELLVQDINERMRTQDVAEAEARIEYLEEKLNDTSIAGMQRVFYQLIESETRTVMLANAHKEYVYKTVDPAVIPQEKIEPKRSVLAVLAIMIGFAVGIFVTIIKKAIRKDRGANN